MKLIIKMETVKLISKLIAGMEGSSVAEQFYSVFANGESMEDKNSNALEYASDCLKQIVDSEALSSVSDEIQVWIDELDAYLVNQS